MRRGVHTVWTDGSGRHSNNPHFRRCGVGYSTDTEERAWLPLPGCLAAGNPSLELNSWPLYEPWKNAMPGEWSVIAKELSKPCRPYNVAEGSPREGIETSKCELGMPFLRLASST
eukprot:4120927-Amphidinium_carterae.2